MDKPPTPTASLVKYFSSLKDPRVERTKKHSLSDMLVIAVCGFICGVDSWVELEEFGEAKREWFEGFLELPHGIPSHDTFGRLFAALDPEAFSRCFIAWVKAVAEVTDGEVVAIDGKTLRRSFDRASSKAAIHMVSAWASRNGLVLGQVKTDEKSNEITAIPKLLELLHLEGCIVTLDAMGCQREVVARIVEKGADYVICVKSNQEALHEALHDFFQEAREERFETVPHAYTETVDKEHGRFERRRYWITSQLDWYRHKRESWAGLTSVGMVEAERTVDGKTSREVRYFISSLTGDDAQKFASAVRRHWTVENNLHWVLDVAFGEDDSRVRKDNAPENMAMLRHLALNLLKADTTTKVGIQTRRKKAGWDVRFLAHLLGVKGAYTPRPPKRKPAASRR
ncbi:ISAs1 family transposase [Myxococcus sp. RHSTA-1-4]|uniref:ISAs1 family transposase n=1 Tax=Myxococcus sp. RHSTA-1-4 TaxID=2874601 RepID=UPI001CBBF809|nr:ISAs1 family transposase [Myxococcus sp. RHSTA-1-4]